MYCKACGRKIDDDSLFCSFCGKKQSITDKSKLTTNTNNSNQEIEIENLGYKLIPFRKGKKWGFCNSKKEIIIECVYNNVEPFQSDRAIVSKCDFHYGIIDRNGSLLCDMKYESIDNFKDGLAIVYKYTPEPDRRKVMGFINLNGEEEIPLIYNEVKQFSEELAMVQLGKKIGFINKSGDVVIDVKYEFDYSFFEGSYTFNNGLCLVNMDYNTYYFINNKGAIVIDCSKYDYIMSFSEGLAAIGKRLPSENDFENTIWGFIDKYGNVVIELKYKAVYSFSEGLAPINNLGKWGFINKKGVIQIPCLYDYAVPFSEGFAQVLMGDYWGYIDKYGKVTIPFIKPFELNIYNNLVLEPFNEGLIPMIDSKKKGFRDGQNRIVIPHIYKYVRSFQNNLALVCPEEKSQPEDWFYIDRSGNEYYEDFESIPLEEVVLKIENYINNALNEWKKDEIHFYIKRNDIISNVSNIYISNFEINSALLYMKNIDKIKFLDNDKIGLENRYKIE